MSILIIIPCYNEEKRLPVDDFEGFLKKNKSIHFLFVNDGSTDKTLEVITKLKENYSTVNTLDLKSNVGKAEAVRQGVLNSLEGTYNYIGYFDADLAAPLNEINNLIRNGNPNSTPYCIMGSRVKLLGYTDIKRDKSRHYFGRVFATIVSSMLALPVYDTQCGAKLIRSDIAREIFQENFISEWLFDVELLFRIKNTFSDYTSHIVEVPLKKWEEKGGSKIKKSFLLKIPFELLKIHLKYRR